MKKFFVCLTIALAAATASAETAMWLRFAKISPNGKEIAFSYKGDIYKVAATGGSAVRLTTQSSYECNPVWSPDGSKIAFASDRKGNFDVYVISANGGTATRLTTNSASEKPTAFSPDGKFVYFSASIQSPASSAMFPTSRMTQLYRVPADGGRSVQVLATPAEEVFFSKSGDFFLYQDQKGYEDEYRKHHTSSVTRDVWRYDVKTGKHTNLTNRGGEDRNAVLSPDGKTVYFLSERNGGSFNVYTFPLSNPAQVKAVTAFKTNPVRFLSTANDGTLCFTQDGEIYTLAPGASPRKVQVDVVNDDEPQIAMLSHTSGARSAIASPDGKQLAFVVRGEVFVTSVDYNTTKKITNTAAAETSITWKDNRTITYASERDGHWQLYTATIARKEDPNFANATLIKEEALLPSKVERAHPDYSPDGKEIAFIEGRSKLMVYNFETKKIRQVTDGSKWHSRSGSFDYIWSPNGKWFALEFIDKRHDPYTDVGVVSAQGGEIHNLTQSGYFDNLAGWAFDGTAVLFASDRYGMRSHASWGSQTDLMVAFLTQDAYDNFTLSKEDYELKKDIEKQQKKDKEAAEKKKDDKKADADKKKDEKATEKKPEVKFDFEGVADRIVRITRSSGNVTSAAATKDGETIYYTNNGELIKYNVRKRDTKTVTKTMGGITMQADGKAMFVTGMQLQKIDLPSEKVTPITYTATMQLDLAAEREYMFNHVYLQERECFYNTNMHGVDWEAMTKIYRKFLPHINNNYDFANMLSEYLGELNVSHTGGRFSPRQVSQDVTASLGLLYDMTYTGKGLKVDEVVTGGPFDHANTKIAAGCIVEKINGEEITASTDMAAIMSNIARKKTLVSIYNPANGNRWDEVVLPISSATLNSLLYDRWVKSRAEEVDRLSGGRLGYVHIQSMNDASFRTIYSDILGKYNDREAIVIDTRFNGGGRLHEDIEVLFSGEKYLTQVIRGYEACDMPSRRWNKPSIMIQCEANYSNAHGTPWVYNYKHMGLLVGMPVPGTMTSVNWETLQDPTLVFGIPVIGYRKADGGYLENCQLEPDIKVANNPETIGKGEDLQLKAAVEVMLKQLDSKK